MLASIHKGSTTVVVVKAYHYGPGGACSEKAVITLAWGCKPAVINIHVEGSSRGSLPLCSVVISMGRSSAKALALVFINKAVGEGGVALADRQEMIWGIC